MSLILVKRSWGIRDILKSLEDPGRKKGKVVGSHIDDLVATRTAMSLCSNCVKGFNPKANKYHISTKFPFCRGKCDACREWSEKGQLFVPMENAAVLGDYHVTR